MWLCSSSTSIIEDRDSSTHLSILTTRVRADIVDLAYIGMIQCRHRAHLALKAIAEALRQHLDRDFAPHPRIARGTPGPCRPRRGARRSRTARGGCQERGSFG